MQYIRHYVHRNFYRPLVLNIVRNRLYSSTVNHPCFIYSVNERLNNLSTHLQVWAQLESRLDELQSDLRSDEETLQLLDTALKGGIVSMEVASSVRDVAKVLSESQPSTQVSTGDCCIIYNIYSHTLTWPLCCLVSNFT